ncbi:hypothetical protein JG687_00005891 [Phytophthora cactorum]|uniref:Uncharacterized protein n=1 Tax=Phytophthora cactorum TaxID=29920 RepID=A0A329SCI2_9STRA|nr:hypothetical protein Pcac1_g6679 [Phytophthora cactorum]KAG3220573.1 hypothetical protein PC129_g8669 [Phytophthora cactorum]KAG6964579.1 hypothetical protein JG687_00005891 [Phytophthora cactorum]RAW33696.1 hypothetical protein PC110_g9971 [Phytophthora cactorum]
MQWTRELNDLLNQCVFASGYDFEASSELFCQQATKLRLWSGDGEVAVTANQCQEHWMALNPTEEDEEEEEADKGEGPETRRDESREQRVVDAIADEEEEYVVVPDGGPRLELSLSDAELDQLLSTLPPREEPEAVDGSSSADAKVVSPRSEMQWVLAFLTDPDAIASVDVEAKNLMRSREKNDDDNYQGFLQDLHEANLMAPAPISAVDGHSEQQHGADKAPVNNTDDSDQDSSDEDQEEWERTRQAMKHSMKLQ